VLLKLSSTIVCPALESNYRLSAATSCATIGETALSAEDDKARSECLQFLALAVTECNGVTRGLACSIDR
jgi:hypothetical protein